MEDDLCEALSRSCQGCRLQGGCCFGARPPLSRERIDILRINGVPDEAMEFEGYWKLRTRPDGYCVLFVDGKCSIHAIKPETCVAGPFTFDIKNRMLQIFLKREAICPMVGFLKANPNAYDALLETSVARIMHLVRGIPAAEMAEILKIDEPETDLVAEIALED